MYRGAGMEITARRQWRLGLGVGEGRKGVLGYGESGDRGYRWGGCGDRD